MLQKNDFSRGDFMRKLIFTLIGVMFLTLGFAQDYKNAQNAPKADERILGTVNTFWGRDDFPPEDMIHNILLEEAKRKFPNKKGVVLRNLTHSIKNMGPNHYPHHFGDMRATVAISFKSLLAEAANKSMNNVREGSRLAIDQIFISDDKLDKATVNDQLIDVLLDKGYKVVAKEYLEKLKEEQEQQAKGGYNEKTKVKTDNLSAVGYFLNVRVTEKSIRIQVVNVSTGEYEGNVTVDF